MAWVTSSPEGRKKQVDDAMEYALERAIAERPQKPMPFVAEKLRVWDNAVNGTWPLRKQAEALFRKGDEDGSGQLDLVEVRAMQGGGAEGMLKTQDGNNDGKVNLAEWLIYIHSLCAQSEEAATSLLDMFDKKLDASRGAQEDGESAT